MQHTKDLKLLEAKIAKEVDNKSSFLNSLYTGQYSKPQNFLSLEYRVQKNWNGFKVFLKNKLHNSKQHKPVFRNDTFFIYDSFLMRTLKVLFSDFEDILKTSIERKSYSNTEIDFNISKEQIEDLCLGKEISLTLTDISPITNKSPQSYSKTFAVDFSFFLSENSMPIKESKQYEKYSDRPHLFQNRNY